MIEDQERCLLNINIAFQVREVDGEDPKQKDSNDFSNDGFELT